MDKALLNKVILHYLSSRDFNGLSLHDMSESERQSSATLVKAGQIEVISEHDFMNPHIRPWPSGRTLDQQAGSITDFGRATASACLYPTSKAMTGRRMPKRFTGKPYSLLMARCKGTLELAYFTTDVLEPYRNDPRFEFDFSDFGVRTGISDEAYLDEEEPDHDSILMGHIGFAYDMSRYVKGDLNSPIVRRVCAYYGDLAKLSDIHQQRWKTYEVIDSSNLNPHPAWWESQMGEWPDGLGPFQRMFFELEALNELNAKICDLPLFRSVERPAGFGWIVRPSQHEWDAFVHALDKLLSENLNARALDALKAPTVNAQGQTIGTVARLEELLKSLKTREENAREVVRPLREVRQARQKPAHAIRANLTDKTFTHKQVALMHDVVDSLIALRKFWQKHPAARDWKEPDYIRDGRVYIT